MKRFYLTFAAAIWFSFSILCQEPIPVVMLEETVELYNSYTAEYPDYIHGPVHLNGKYTQHKFGELLIMLKAFYEVGYEPELEFIPTETIIRERESVISGLTAVSAETYFSSVFTDDVYMSSAVIPLGAFIKGIYGLPGNRALHAVRNLNDLRRFTAVSVIHWKIDWQTLESLDLAHLYGVSRDDLIPNMIGERGIDFTLFSIPYGDDFAISSGGYLLTPVPHILIALMDTRHFMVSRRHPKGGEVYAALEKGLRILNDKGIIHEILKDCGLYRDDLKEWKILNLESE